MTKKNITIASILLLIALTIIIGIGLTIAKTKGLLAQVDLGSTVAVVLVRSDARLVEKAALRGSHLDVDCAEKTVLPGLELRKADLLLERGLLS